VGKSWRVSWCHTCLHFMHYSIQESRTVHDSASYLHGCSSYQHQDLASTPSCSLQCSLQLLCTWWVSSMLSIICWASSFNVILQYPLDLTTLFHYRSLRVQHIYIYIHIYIYAHLVLLVTRKNFPWQTINKAPNKKFPTLLNLQHPTSPSPIRYFKAQSLTFLSI